MTNMDFGVVKFGGSFIPETLKKPIEDLTNEFQRLRNNKKF